MRIAIIGGGISGLTFAYSLQKNGVAYDLFEAAEHPGGTIVSLRDKIDPQIKTLIKLEVNKDYTHSNGQELRAQLEAHQDKSA